MQFNAVVEINDHTIRLWESLGFTILATVPEASDILTVGWSASHHGQGPAIAKVPPGVP
jgi:hypothetical protein